MKTKYISLIIIILLCVSFAVSGNVIVKDGQLNVSNNVYVDSSGNVGIGTTSPNYLLDVNGLAHADSAFAVGTSPSGSGVIRLPNAGMIGWRNAADTGDLGAIYLNGLNDLIIINSIGGQPIDLSAYTVFISTLGAAYPALIVKGAGSQTADLQQWQDNTGTVLNVVDASGNVGIGTGSPSTKLDVDENSDNSAIIRINSGTSSSQYSAIDFYDQSNNEWGIGKDKNNDFYIDEFGEGTRLLIKQGGNIGIGTESPNAKLHLNYTSAAPELRITGKIQDDSISPFFSLVEEANNLLWGFSLMYLTNSNRLDIRRLEGELPGAGTPILSIDRASGNVGIRTTMPNASLVVSAESGKPSIVVKDGFDIAFPPDQTLSIGTWDGTSFDEKMQIQNDGNVGIGTASPESALHIQSPVGAGMSLGVSLDRGVHIGIDSNEQAGIELVGYSAGGDAYIDFHDAQYDGDADFRIAGGATALQILTSDNTGNLGNGNNPVAFFRQDGNVGIGTATPDFTLDVQGQIRATGGTLIFQCPSGDPDYLRNMCVGQLSTSSQCEQADAGCPSGCMVSCTAVGRLVAP